MLLPGVILVTGDCVRVAENSLQCVILRKVRHSLLQATDIRINVAILDQNKRLYRSNEAPISTPGSHLCSLIQDLSKVPVQVHNPAQKTAQ
jgi:hypothetical protein